MILAPWYIKQSGLAEITTVRIKKNAYLLQLDSLNVEPPPPKKKKKPRKKNNNLFVPSTINLYKTTGP